MMKDKFYYKLKDKMYDVASIPAQNTGPFDFLWKKTVPFFKQAPLRVYLLCAVIGSFFLFLLSGSYLVKIVSLLQRGF